MAGRSGGGHSRVVAGAGPGPWRDELASAGADRPVLECLHRPDHGADPGDGLAAHVCRRRRTGAGAERTLLQGGANYRGHAGHVAAAGVGIVRHVRQQQRPCPVVAFAQQSAADVATGIRRRRAGGTVCADLAGQPGLGGAVHFVCDRARAVAQDRVRRAQRAVGLGGAQPARHAFFLGAQARHHLVRACGRVDGLGNGHARQIEEIGVLQHVHLVPQQSQQLLAERAGGVVRRFRQRRAAAPQLLQDLREQLVLAGKMVVHGALGNTGRGGDLVHAGGFEAAGAELGNGGIDDGLALAHHGAHVVRQAGRYRAARRHTRSRDHAAATVGCSGSHPVPPGPFDRLAQARRRLLADRPRVFGTRLAGAVGRPAAFPPAADRHCRPAAHQGHHPVARPLRPPRLCRRDGAGRPDRTLHHTAGRGRPPDRLGHSRAQGAPAGLVAEYAGGRRTAAGHAGPALLRPWLERPQQDAVGVVRDRAPRGADLLFRRQRLLRRLQGNRPPLRAVRSDHGGDGRLRSAMAGRAHAAGGIAAGPHRPARQGHAADTQWHVRPVAASVARSVFPHRATGGRTPAAAGHAGDRHGARHHAADGARAVVGAAGAAGSGRAGASGVRLRPAGQRRRQAATLMNLPMARSVLVDTRFAILYLPFGTDYRRLQRADRRDGRQGRRLPAQPHGAQPGAGTQQCVRVDFPVAHLGPGRPDVPRRGRGDVRRARTIQQAPDSCPGVARHRAARVPADRARAPRGRPGGVAHAGARRTHCLPHPVQVSVHRPWPYPAKRALRLVRLRPRGRRGAGAGTPAGAGPPPRGAGQRLARPELCARAARQFYRVDGGGRAGRRSALPDCRLQRPPHGSPGHAAVAGLLAAPQRRHRRQPHVRRRRGARHARRRHRDGPGHVGGGVGQHGRFSGRRQRRHHRPARTAQGRRAHDRNAAGAGERHPGRRPAGTVAAGAVAGRDDRGVQRELTRPFNRSRAGRSCARCAQSRC
uniref:Uncharacterized protein n=1 Tax=Tanacetum cinerariifolium TaxID=118510 RepID=A0A699GJQ0_TANCI|nr:hypothetical protein [Tanacetum cinerariifolium]